MNISFYQAAAAYFTDASAHRLPVDMLVVDAEAMSAGICRCAVSGDIELAAHEDNDDGRQMSAVWLEGIGVQGVSTAQLADEKTNSVMWNFYRSGKLMNSSTEQSLRTDQIDSGFDAVRAVLGDRLDRLFNAAGQHGISEEDIKVLVIGEMAHCASMQMLLRERLCFDPFLSMGLDDRFVSMSSPGDREKIFAAGKELLSGRRTAGIEITLLCVNERMEEVCLPLIDKNSPAPRDSGTPFGRPVFVGVDSRLRFRVNDREGTAVIPRLSGDRRGVMAEFSVAFEENEPVVRWRSMTEPNEVYKLEITYC